MYWNTEKKPKPQKWKVSKREHYTEKVTVSDRLTEEKSSVAHQGGKLDCKWKKTTFKAENKGHDYNM